MTSPVVLDGRIVTGAGGGPDKTILNSPRFLEPLGYRMLCAYLRPPGDAGFDVIRRKAREANAPLIEIDDRGPFDWRVVKELLGHCRRENVAIWHGHDYKTNALGLLLKRFHPMRLVTTVHGWVRHTSRTPLYYRIDKFCLPRYEKVICVSDDLFEDCLACGVPAKNLVLIENGIDAATFTRTRTTADARAALGLPAKGWLIGAVGRLSPEKGFDDLLRAVAMLRDGGHDVNVLIVGDGDERGRLEALANEFGLQGRAFFPGWQADVRGHYEAMDVFALSSLREGLPNVLLEAMALKVPVVATAVNGVPRLVQDGRNGRLVDAGDAPALAMAIAQVLTNDEMRDAFRRAGRETVETRYSFATRMAKLRGLYDAMSL